MHCARVVINDKQSGPEKMSKVTCTLILQPFAAESRGFHQNAQKYHCLPVNAKSVSVGSVFFDKNSRNWIHVMSDVTLHENI